MNRKTRRTKATLGAVTAVAAQTDEKLAEADERAKKKLSAVMEAYDAEFVAPIRRQVRLLLSGLILVGVVALIGALT